MSEVGEGWAAWDVRSPRHTGGMDDAELTAAERLLLVRLYVAAAGQAGCCWRTPYGRLVSDPAPQTTPGPRHAKPDRAHDL